MMVLERTNASKIIRYYVICNLCWLVLKYHVNKKLKMSVHILSHLNWHILSLLMFILIVVSTQQKTVFAR